MLFESIFKDIQIELLIQIFENDFSHMIAFTNNNRILTAQVIKCGKCGSEHRVSRYKTKARLFIETLQTCFDRCDIANDAIFWQIGKYVAKSLQSILHCHSIDKQFGLKFLDFIERREAVSVIHETQLLRVSVVYGCLVVETKHIVEKRPHLTGS